MSAAAGSLAWFAGHELRLAWRDGVAMLTGGRRRRAIGVAIGFVVFAVFMHALAYFMVGRFADIGVDPPKSTLLYVTVIMLLSASLVASQALEAVTRAFYARADLDLLLSSPTDARRAFAVRIGATALTTMAMGMLLAGPFINILAFLGGPHWLAAYGVVVAIGGVAVAFSVALTLLLFRLIGPERTRFVAQVLAAVIGAAFVIGLQGAAILSYGTISRFAILQSETLARVLPAVDSVVWWPARAVLGDLGALAAMLAVAVVLLAAATVLFAGRFAHYATLTAGLSGGDRRASATASPFRRFKATRALRRKEWVLLRRDPWLVSQTLMQLLYLAPPALLLWQQFGDAGDAVAVVAPVVVVAAGQLAGGLAWLAISGEDAPELVATAPVPTRAVIRAKVEAVFIGTGAVSLPFVVAIAWASPYAAAVTAAAILAASVASTLIQLVFRSQAKRSHFRRRQTSSRFATLAEALSSMAWAATAGLAIAGSWLAIGSGLAALAIVALAFAIRPRTVTLSGVGI